MCPAADITKQRKLAPVAMYLTRLQQSCGVVRRGWRQGDSVCRHRMVWGVVRRGLEAASTVDPADIRRLLPRRSRHPSQSGLIYARRIRHWDLARARVRRMQAHDARLLRRVADGRQYSARFSLRNTRSLAGNADLAWRPSHGNSAMEDHLSCISLALSAIDTLDAEYKQRGVRVVILADDTDSPTVAAVMDSARIRTPVALAASTLMATFTHGLSPLPWRKAFGLPTFLVLDARGRVVHQQFGIETQPDQRLRAMRAIRVQLDSMLRAVPSEAAR
ncbi:hypothetical protein BH11GEM1_BH11GEM1_20900 [soil metagenome]